MLISKNTHTLRILQHKLDQLNITFEKYGVSIITLYIPYYYINLSFRNLRVFLVDLGIAATSLYVSVCDRTVLLSCCIDLAGFGGSG